MTLSETQLLALSLEETIIHEQIDSVISTERDLPKVIQRLADLKYTFDMFKAYFFEAKSYNRSIMVNFFAVKYPGFVNEIFERKTKPDMFQVALTDIVDFNVCSDMSVENLKKYAQDSMNEIALRHKALILLTTTYENRRKSTDFANYLVTHYSQLMSGAGSSKKDELRLYKMYILTNILSSSSNDSVAFYSNAEQNLPADLAFIIKAGKEKALRKKNIR